MRTHGTVSNYRAGRCRCPDCTAAYLEACGRYATNRRASERQPANPGPWVADAACQGLTDMFTVNTSSVRRSGAHIAVQATRAVAVCHTCPVLGACRDWALSYPDPAYNMVAGGLDPHQRNKLRRAAG